MTKIKKSTEECYVDGCFGRSEYICDQPGCHAPLCRKHAKLVKHGVHSCPDHAIVVTVFTPIPSKL